MSNTLQHEQRHYHFLKKNAIISIATDSSFNGVGGVLQQLVNNNWQLLAFCGRKLSQAEQKYSTFSRELLGVKFCIKKFKYFLESKTFHILTDNKAVCAAIRNCKQSDLLPRELRYLEYISQYTNDARHISGIENITADTFSRIYNIYHDLKPIQVSEIQTSQQNNKELAGLMQKNNFHFVKIPISPELSLYMDTSYGLLRPFVGENYRQQIFNHYHNIHHLGYTKTPL